jgi:hypothetical protein
VDVLPDAGAAAVGTRQNRLAYINGTADDDGARWFPETDALFSDASFSGNSSWIEMRLRFAELRPFGFIGYGDFIDALWLVEFGEDDGTIGEFALTLQSTLDEGIGSRPDEQPETKKWQVPDDLQTSGVVARKAGYFQQVFKEQRGTALALEVFDSAPDAEAVFTRGFVLQGMAVRVRAEEGLRRVPREMQK